jgi:hypothetical protein
MEKIHLVFSSITGDYLSNLKEEQKMIQEYYNKISADYQDCLKTKNSIATYDKYIELQSAKVNLQHIKSSIDFVQSELDKSKHSVFSSYTGDDLASLEGQIKEALATYQKYVDEYNWGIQNGSSSYAKRVRKPRMDAAKSVLDTMNAQKKAMLSDMGQIQGIELVEKTTNIALTEPESETPWKTIGLAVGALVAIVVIVKVL